MNKQAINKFQRKNSEFEPGTGINLNKHTFREKTNTKVFKNHEGIKSLKKTNILPEQFCFNFYSFSFLPVNQFHQNWCISFVWLCTQKQSQTRGSLAKKKDNVFAMQKQSVPKRI